MKFSLETLQVILLKTEFRKCMFYEGHSLCRVSRGKCARLRENVPYIKVHRYNAKHLYPKLNGYGDNGERILKV